MQVREAVGEELAVRLAAHFTRPKPKKKVLSEAERLGQEVGAIPLTLALTLTLTQSSPSPQL